MAYVCLGRCEKLEDIHIVGKFNPDCIKVDERALEETKRLHQLFIAEKSKVESEFNDCFTITYLNVNRLFPHLDDIELDHELMRSDIISLGETWMKKDDTVTFEAQGFKGIFANVGDGQGLASFAKSFNQASFELSTDQTFSATFIKTVAVDIISLYLSQDFDWAKLKMILDEWIMDQRPVAIIGDVNLNYNEKKKHPFINYLEKMNFMQLIKKPTHDKGGLLDHIYINKKLQEQKSFSRQRSVYYSDHDAITLHIPISISQ